MIISGFDFLKCYCWTYPFATLCWVNNNEKNIAQQILPAHRTIYFSQTLETKLLSETTISQAQLTFNCTNSAILTVDESRKHAQN